MDDEFADLVPDEDEEIPEDSEDLEEETPEVPLEVLARCRSTPTSSPLRNSKRPP